MQEKISLKFLAVVLSFILTCPFPLSQQSAHVSINTSCLAPNSLTGESLLISYDEMEPDITPVQVHAADFCQKENLLGTLRKGKIVTSGTVIMNQTGAELFAKHQPTKDMIRSAAFYENGKMFNNQFTNKYSDVSRPAQSLHVIPSNGILLSAGKYSYQTEMFNSMVLPSCVVPFFCDPAMNLTVRGNSGQETALSVFIRVPTQPIGDYLKSKELSARETASVISSLLRAVDEYMASSFGRVAGLSLDSFEIDPITGKVYFVAIENAFDIYSKTDAHQRKKLVSDFQREQSLTDLVSSASVDQEIANYYKFVSTVASLNSLDAKILAVWKDYKDALLDAGPGGDSWTEEIPIGEPELIIDKSHSEQQLQLGNHRNVYYETVEVIDESHYAQHTSKIPHVGAQDLLREKARQAFLSKLPASVVPHLPYRFKEDPVKYVEDDKHPDVSEDAYILSMMHRNVESALRRRVKTSVFSALSDMSLHKGFIERLVELLPISTGNAGEIHSAA